MSYQVEYSWQARAAVDSLSSPERDMVVAAIDRLRSGPNPPGLPQVYRLRGAEGLHVMRAGRDLRLRVLFTLEGDKTVRVQDVVTHDLVRLYRESVSS